MRNNPNTDIINDDDDDDDVSIETDTNISAVMWTDPLLPPQSQQQRRRRRRLLDRHAIRHVDREQARSTGTTRSSTSTTPNSNNNATTTTTTRTATLFLLLRQTIKWWCKDWFHTLAYQKTTTLIVYLFLTYITLILSFAGLYYTLSRTIGCEMDLHVLMEALYFSLSTQATIGYGVSDYYFGGCWTPFGLVLLQVWTSLLFDAVAIGLIFQRLSRGQKRSQTVWFSRVACVRRVRNQNQSNKWYLYIRLAEGRHHPLFQTQVKGYCVRHERQRTSTANDTTASSTNDHAVQTTHFVTRSVDWLESNVWMRLPQMLVHVLDDETSPLVPPVGGWYDAQGHWRVSSGMNSATVNNDRDAASFAQSIQDYWYDRHIELIVLLEGIDALTGCMSQTQHSYTVDDLVWQAQFVPCVKPTREGGGCVVDFAQFHETRPVHEEMPCPYL